MLRFKSINSLFMMLLSVLVLTAACHKIDWEFPIPEYVEPVVIPDRTVETDPDATKNIKFILNGQAVEQRMVAGYMNRFEPNEHNVYAQSLKVEIRLDSEGETDGFGYVCLFLPFDEWGHMAKKSKFVVDSNMVESTLGDAADLIFSYSAKLNQWNNDPPALYTLDYPNAKDQTDYWLSFSVEIDSLDTEKHLLTGFMDSLVMVKKDDPTVKLVLKDAEFAVAYDHAEMKISSESIAGEPYSLFSSMMYSNTYLQNSETGKLYGISIGSLLPIPDGAGDYIDVGIDGEQFFNETDRKSKGIGTYIYPKPLDNAPPSYVVSMIGLLGSRTYFYLSSEAKLVIDAYNTNEYIRGSFDAEVTQVNGTGTEFLPGVKPYHLTCSFTKRKL